MIVAVLASIVGIVAACGDDLPNPSGPPTTTTNDAAASDAAAVEAAPSSPDGSAPSGPSDPTSAARAAVVLGSCVPNDGVQRYLSNIYFRRSSDPASKLMFEDAVECLATKGTGCQAVAECAGVTIDVTPTPADCATGCTGTMRTACDSRLRVREDCARYGEECVFDGRDSACAPSGAPVCRLESTCVGGRPSYCTGATEKYGPECGSLGLTCKSGGCVGPGEACPLKEAPTDAIDYSTGVSCSAGTLQACVNGGVVGVACGALAKGFSCQSVGVDGGQARVFCGLASECTAGSRRTTTCDGDSVVVCNAGRVDRVDCKTLGFTTCDAKFGGCVPNLASNNGG